MTFSRASNYTSLDRKQTMQTFSSQRHCGKINVSSPKVALLPSIQHLPQNMPHDMALFYNTKIQNAPPWKLTNVEWFQTIKFAYRGCKGKKHNKPADPWNHILYLNMKKPRFGTVLKRKTEVCFVSSKRQDKKTCNLPWCNTQATGKSTNCLLFFVNGTVF